MGGITTSGTITEQDTPSASAEPAGIATDNIGNIWFTEEGANSIGELAF